MTNRALKVVLGEFGCLIFVPLLIFVSTLLVSYAHRYVSCLAAIFILITLIISLPLWNITRIWLVKKSEIIFKIDWSGFIDSLKNDNSDKNLYLMNFFDEKMVSIIRKWTPDTGIDERIRSQLNEALLKVIERKDFYKREIMSDISLVEEYQTLLEKGADCLTKEELKKLNKKLLESVYLSEWIEQLKLQYCFINSPPTSPECLQSAMQPSPQARE